VDESYKLNIEPSTGNQVWGVIWAVAEAERQTLQDYEGRSYRSTPVWVNRPETGMEIEVSTFIAQGNNVEDNDGSVYDWYYRYVINGAKQHHLPDDCVRNLEAIAYDPDPDNTRWNDNMDILCGMGLKKESVFASEIKGYGEDSLTFWSLNTRLPELLFKLGEKAHPCDCTVFYRPSFGRGGKSKALFGEFDAILIAPNSGYLIESKWEGSSEVSSKCINLRGGQCQRHRIFNWYHQNWDRAMNWGEFIRKHEDEFSDFKDEDGNSKEIAPEGTELAKNIMFILKRVPRDLTLRNILLLFVEGDSTSQCAIKVNGKGADEDKFKCIVLNYSGEGSSKFFSMLNG
jgi:hypothetical protein